LRDFNAVKVPSFKTIRNTFFRIFPQAFWLPYSQKAQNLGFKDLTIILSFDCDTRDDAKASLTLYNWLSDRNIPATFAVPGFQLEENADIYTDIMNQGGQFMNHGGSPHTIWKENRYRSTTFYNKMPPSAVKEDIEKGHDTFIKVLGKNPKGFRAPHFGHFQKSQQLELIYQILHDLGGYRFTSTTVPAAARQKGPIFKKGDLYEIPVLGSYFWPLRIFDSWGYRRDTMSRQVKDDYASDLVTTLRTLTNASIPALLNYYADPSHVVNNQPYYQALDSALQLGAVFSDYERLIKSISEPID
jgi:hypothetical protein